MDSKKVKEVGGKNASLGEMFRELGSKVQAPSDFPEMARFLVEQGIDSISFNQDGVATGIENIVKAEK